MAFVSVAVLAAAGTAFAAATIGSTIYQGEQQKRGQKRALASQEKAQRQSLLSSIAEEKRAGQAERQANKRKPDVTAILFRERAAARAGAGSTILAGRGRSGTSLLGSKSSLMGTDGS